MCYGGEYLYSETTEKLHWVNHKDLHQLEQSGRLKHSDNGRFYPRHIIPMAICEDGVFRVVPARFDLIVRDYRSKLKEATIADLVKLKNSRKKDPKTGRPTGYSSWNARVETIHDLFSFRMSWNYNRRGVVPITAFLERPNEEDTPPDFKNKEFKIDLAEPAWLGMVWDKIERQGEELYSFAIVTRDSDGHRIRKELHHIRMPTLLTTAEAEEWLNPNTAADRAFDLVDQYPGELMKFTEMVKEPKKAIE
jgi:putative SOS response-associated peptidase YedK